MWVFVCTHTAIRIANFYDTYSKEMDFGSENLGPKSL